MPTLILPPRITPDTDAIFAAAQAAGWEALRLDSWRIPAGLNGRDVVLYGEPLFADVAAPRSVSDCSRHCLTGYPACLSATAGVR